jgi:RecB family endonuclease NucS
MRIWLKHKDATSDGDTALENDLDDEDSVSELEVEHFTLSLERDLQRALRGNLGQLEPGLVAVDAGKEQGFRDITAKDKAGSIVIIELKAGKAGAEAVSQLLAYMGEVKAQEGLSFVRGILVARDFQSKAMAAASVVPNVILKRYQFHLTFENTDAPPPA